MVIILTIKSPEVDPEVCLKTDHLMDLVVSLLQVTEPMDEIGVEIGIIGLIVAHIIMMVMTDTISVMIGFMTTGFMTLTVDFMAEVYGGRYDNRNRFWPPPKGPMTTA